MWIIVYESCRGCWSEKSIVWVWLNAIELNATEAGRLNCVSLFHLETDGIMVPTAMTVAIVVLLMMIEVFKFEL